jgi:signal transduction histidine kinase
MMKTIEVSCQKVTFETENNCLMLTFRDISHLQKLQDQQKKLEVIDAVTANVAHNMITPLKSISLLSQNIAVNKGSNHSKDATLVYSTSQLLLSEVMLLLDRNQLDKERFQPNFQSLSVN